MSRSNGHCMTMGTASTMACVTEALGLTLPGGAAIPAVDSRRRQLAEAAGRQIVELVERGPEAVRHPHARGVRERDPRAARDLGLDERDPAPARVRGPRRGRRCRSQLFDELCASTPWLVDLKPAGRFLMEDFFYAGGVPAVMAQIADLLHLRRAHGHRPDGRREHRRCPRSSTLKSSAPPTSRSTPAARLSSCAEACAPTAP